MDASEPFAETQTSRGSTTGGVRTSRTGEIPEFTDLVFASRHKPLRVLLIGSVLSIGLVWTAWLATNPRYRAEGLVRVRQQQDVIFSAQTSRSTDVNFFHSQEQLALSPQVLATALGREDLHALGDLIPVDDPTKWLREQMKVDMQKGSEVLSIAAVNDSPRIAYALANAVTEAYIDEVTGRLERDRQRREQELERAAQKADQQLDELWSQLNRAAQDVGTDNSQSLTIRDELQLQAYRDYSRQLQNAVLRGNELEAQWIAAQQQTEQEDPVAGPVTEAMIHNDPEVVAAKQRIQAVQAQVEEMRQIVADLDSPRLQRLQDDLKFYEADLEKVIASRTAVLEQQLRNQTESAQENILVALQQQITRNRAEKEFLRQRLSEIDTGIARADEQTGVQLEMLRHAIQRQTRLADQLWQSLQELRIEGQSQPRIALMKLPSIPTRADHSRQIKAAAAAGLLAWALAVLGVGFVEWSECRIRFPEDLASRFVFPVFGKIAASGGSMRKKVASNGAREAAAQMMLQAGDGETIPTIMVASATANEPRHVVATDVAQSLCKFRCRTLLIDADATAPRLSRALGVDRLPGLRQLSESCDAHPLIIPSEDPRLDFLPIGPRGEEDHWISPDVISHVIDSLRGEYQAIVVSGAPLSSSGESLLAAARVERLLMTVQLGTSRWDELATAAQSAAQAGIRIAGCILQTTRRAKKLQLEPDRQGQTDGEALDTVAAESSLRDQINEMKRALDEARAPSAKETATETSPSTASAKRATSAGPTAGGTTSKAASTKSSAAADSSRGPAT